MDNIHIAILLLTVLDAGIIILAHQFDKIMYKPLPFLRLEPGSSKLFFNAEFDEPVNRILLSTGGKLLMVIGYLAVIMITLIH